MADIFDEIITEERQRDIFDEVITEKEKPPDIFEQVIEEERPVVAPVSEPDIGVVGGVIAGLRTGVASIFEPREAISPLARIVPPAILEPIQRFIAPPEEVQEELRGRPSFEIGRAIPEQAPLIVPSARVGSLVKAGLARVAAPRIAAKLLVPAADIGAFEFLRTGEPGEAVTGAAIGGGFGLAGIVAAPVIRTIPAGIRRLLRRPRVTAERLGLPPPKERLLLPFNPEQRPVISLPGEFPPPAIIQPGIEKALAITGERAPRFVPEEARVIFSGPELLSIEGSVRTAGRRLTESPKAKQLILKEELATPRGEALIKTTPKEKAFPDLRTQREIVELRLRQNHPELSDALNSEISRATIESALERSAREAATPEAAFLEALGQPRTPARPPVVQPEFAVEVTRPRVVTPPRAAVRPPEVIEKFRTERITRPIAKGSVIETTEPKAFIDDPKKWRDLAKFTGQFKESYRAIETVVQDPQVSTRIKDFLVRPREEAVFNAGVERLTLIQEVKDVIVDTLGIGRASKESALVMRFGEKRMTLEELQKASPKKWRDIVRAVDWFRNQYDNGAAGIRRLNEIQGRFQNTVTPRREDYFAHIRETNNFWDEIIGTDIGFETDLGIFQKLKRPFNPHNLKRGRGPFQEDAIQSFDRYSDHVLSEIHLTEHIQRLDQFATEIGKRTDRLPIFIKFLRNNAQQLGRVGSDLDKALAQNAFTGPVLRATRIARRTLGRSLILGNLRSVFMQSIPMTQLAGEIGFSKTMKAAASAASDWAGADFVGKNSKFIGRRYRDIKISKIIPLKFKDKPFRATVENMDKFGGWMFLQADELGVRTIWSGLYDDFLSQGFVKSRAIQLADEKTLKIVGGRAIGELPPALTNEFGRVALTFQLEVNNYLQFLVQDIGRDPKKLGRTFIAGFLLNETFERTLGTSPLFDPIGASWDAYQIISSDEPTKVKPVLVAGRITGEVIGNLPGGQLLSSLYPQYGKTIFGWKSPTRQQIFARTEAGRFGPVPILAFKQRWDRLEKSPRDLVRFLALFVPAGTPMARTVEGIIVSSTGEVRDPKGKLLFKVKEPLDQARAILFGPFSTSEGQEFLRKREKIKKKTLFR